MKSRMLFASSFWLLAVFTNCFLPIQAQVKETTTTESQEFAYPTLPTRTIATRTEQDGRTIETSTLQEPSTSAGYTTLGGWTTLMETEQQSTRTDANTTTVVKRQYVRDVNGNRRLVGVTEERWNTSADGRETVVRTVSNADVNDRLQVVEREVQETMSTSNDTRQTTSTLTRYSADGFPFEQRSRQVEQRRGDVTEQRTTAYTPDGHGNFVPIYRTESTTTRTASGQKEDERVYRDTGIGQMTVVQREVSTESNDRQGSHSVTQTYSAFSSQPAGSPVLIQQISTSRRRGPDGSSQAKQEIKRIDFGNPALGLQLATSVTETSQPTSNGETTHQIVRGADGNGGFPVVRRTDSTRVMIQWPH